MTDGSDGGNPVHVQTDASWLPPGSRLETHLGADLPPFGPATGAFVLAFDDAGRVLFTEVRARGLDVPGGHVEAGETPEAAARREALEETGCRLGHLIPVGQIRLHVPAPPPGYRYPVPDSHHAVFAARIAERLPFVPTAECAPPRLLWPEEARAALSPMHRPLLDAARRVFGL